MAVVCLSAVASITLHAVVVCQQEPSWQGMPYIDTAALVLSSLIEDFNYGVTCSMCCKM
jgi:hypothetical protein